MTVTPIRVNDRDATYYRELRESEKTLEWVIIPDIMANDNISIISFPFHPSLPEIPLSDIVNFSYFNNYLHTDYHLREKVSHTGSSYHYILEKSHYPQYSKMPSESDIKKLSSTIYLSAVQDLDARIGNYLKLHYPDVLEQMKKEQSTCS